MVEEEPTETLPPGTNLGRYQIVRLLGRGGMGAVYEGTHLDLKKRVAIKTLHPSVAALPGARARFLREGEAASRIQHPNVVDVTDVGTSDNGVTYLVMEFLEGHDLGARLARSEPIPVTEAVDILLPVLAAIAVAHDEGVIHRDLKPENIFLARTRHGGLEPKVLDFGISKISSRGNGNTMALTGTGASMGTPYYIAPEQVRSAAGVDARSDQYALGAILYECVTGRRAHEGETIYEVIRSVGDGSFKPPRALKPDLPVEIEQAILRAMKLEPAQRFASVRALGRAILPFASPGARAQWAPALEGDGQAPRSTALSGTDPQPGGTVIMPTPLPGRAPTPRTAVAPPPNTTFGASAAQITLEPPRKRTGAIVAVVAVLGAGAAGAYFLFSPAAHRAADGPSSTLQSPDVTATPKASKRYHVSVAAKPREADFELDGKSVGAGSFVDDLLADGTEHTLTVTAAGFVPARLTFRDSPPPDEVALQPIAAPPKPVVEEPIAVEKPSAHASHASAHAHAHAAADHAKSTATGTTKPSGPMRTENNAAIIDD
ncbi:MAG TPA: serine/threonine-protein kinase [Polyangia bacterium]|nr:serine/threonine-protein kinase [Polyangia bacterium]